MPKALILSVLITGRILVICTWFLLLGWGTEERRRHRRRVATCRRSILADKYWGSAYWIVLLALVNSTIAVCIASNLVGTRMWYSMAEPARCRSGSLRSIRKYKTPWNATHAQFVVIVGSAVILTWWWGKDNIWFVDGGMITFALGAMYMLGSLAVLMYFWTRSATSSTRSCTGCSRCVSICAIRILWYKSLNPFPAGAVQVGPRDGVRVVRARYRRGRGARCHR